MPVASVASVEIDGMPGQEPSHEHGKPGRAAFDQQMRMIIHQSPGANRGAGFRCQIAKPLQESFPILIVIHDATSFNTPNNHVVQGSGGVQTRASGV